MIEGKTKSGFEYQIEDERFNDWETLELMSDLDEDMSLIVKVAKRIFSKEEYAALKEHCRVDGKIKVDQMVEELSEILNANDDSKNS